MEAFWPFPFFKDGQVLRAHFSSVTPRTPCILQRSGVILLLGYQVLGSKLYYFLMNKGLVSILCTIYHMGGGFIPHTQRRLRNLNVDHLCFVRFPFSPTFFTEIKKSNFAQLGKIFILSKVGASQE